MAIEALKGHTHWPPMADSTVDSIADHPVGMAYFLGD